MATIRRINRKSGTAYKAIIRDRHGRQLKSKTFTRKGDATAWAKRLEADRERMEALGSPGAALTVKELVKEYSEAWSDKCKSTPSRIQWWADRLGNLKLIDVTADELRRALDDYAAGKALRGDGVDAAGKPKTKATKRTRAPATVNRLRAVGSGMFKYVRQQGYLHANPFSNVPSRTEPRGRVRYLSNDERQRLLKACAESEWDRLLLLVTLATTTGARLGELTKLRWSNVDPERREAHLVDMKNGDDRIVPLPQPAIDELTRHTPKQNGELVESKTCTKIVP